MSEKSPFRQVVDEMTGGCGCACHMGVGYNTSCQHCQPNYIARLQQCIAELEAMLAGEQALAKQLRVALRHADIALADAQAWRATVIIREALEFTPKQALAEEEEP